MKKYGLIGFPLNHSFSKKYFEDKFERECINSRFELYPIADLKYLPALLRAEPLLQGLAVTIPHKEKIIDVLQETDPAVSMIGAVNCIKISGGILKGFNTDVIGFERSLFPLLKSYHTQALILGTGGASRAVQFVLKKLHITFALVSASAKSNLSYQDINESYMNKYLLIINCTPLGMFPDIKMKPSIPYQFITNRHLLFDMVYNPEETAFLQEGRKHDAQIKNGLEMLYIQAEENWRIWND